jgi:hypothetical protein
VEQVERGPEAPPLDWRQRARTGTDGATLLIREVPGQAKRFADKLQRTAPQKTEDCARALVGWLAGLLAGSLMGRIWERATQQQAAGCKITYSVALRSGRAGSERADRVMDARGDALEIRRRQPASTQGSVAAECFFDVLPAATTAAAAHARSDRV